MAKILTKVPWTRLIYLPFFKLKNLLKKKMKKKIIKIL